MPTESAPATIARFERSSPAADDRRERRERRSRHSRRRPARRCGRRRRAGSAAAPCRAAAPAAAGSAPMPKAKTSDQRHDRPLADRRMPPKVTPCAAVQKSAMSLGARAPDHRHERQHDQPDHVGDRDRHQAAVAVRVRAVGWRTAACAVLFSRSKTTDRGADQPEGQRRAEDQEARGRQEAGGRRAAARRSRPPAAARARKRRKRRPDRRAVGSVIRRSGRDRPAAPSRISPATRQSPRPPRSTSGKCSADWVVVERSQCRVRPLDQSSASAATAPSADHQPRRRPRPRRPRAAPAGTACVRGASRLPPSQPAAISTRTKGGSAKKPALVGRAPSRPLRIEGGEEQPDADRRHHEPRQVAQRHQPGAERRSLVAARRRSTQSISQRRSVKAIDEPRRSPGPG